MAVRVDPFEWMSRNCDDRLEAIYTDDSWVAESAMEAKQSFLKAEALLGNRSNELSAMRGAKPSAVLEVDTAQLQRVADDSNVKTWLQISMVCEEKGSLLISIDETEFYKEKAPQPSGSSFFQKCQDPKEVTKRYSLAGGSKFKLPRITIQNKSWGRIKYSYNIIVENVELSLKIRSAEFFKSDFDTWEKNSNLSAQKKKDPEDPRTHFTTDSDFPVMTLILVCCCFIIWVLVCVTRCAGLRGEGTTPELVMIPELLEKETEKRLSSSDLGKFADGS
jgi:hypothetical protein